MENLLDEAIIFAVKAHSGSLRKGTDIPYIVPPMEAAAIVGTMTSDPATIAAAVLHDTVEDTDTTIEDIRCIFGERVAFLVGKESEDKQEERPAGDTWKQRKQATLDHLARESDKTVLMITLGDKLSNLRAIRRDLSSFKAAGCPDIFWARFNQKDPAMHAWYYKSIGECLKPLRDTAAYAEYTELLEKTFD